MLIGRTRMEKGPMRDRRNEYARTHFGNLITRFFDVNCLKYSYVTIFTAFTKKLRVNHERLEGRHHTVLCRILELERDQTGLVYL